MFTSTKIVLDVVHLLGNRLDDRFASVWQLAKTA